MFISIDTTDPEPLIRPKCRQIIFKGKWNRPTAELPRLWRTHNDNQSVSPQDLIEFAEGINHDRISTNPWTWDVVVCEAAITLVSETEYRPGEAASFPCNCRTAEMHAYLQGMFRVRHPIIYVNNRHDRHEPVYLPY